MRGSKTTVHKRAEVVAIKVNSPGETVRSLAKKVDLPKSTTYDVLMQELGQIGREEELLEKIIKQDLENIGIGTLLAKTTMELQLRKAKEGKEADLSKLSAILGDSTKRRQLFTGGTTENIAVAAKTYLPAKDNDVKDSNVVNTQ